MQSRMRFRNVLALFLCTAVALITSSACTKAEHTSSTQLVVSSSALPKQDDQQAGQEQLEDTVNTYNQEIESDPQNANAFLQRGIAYHDLGNYGQAIDDFSSRISLEPT